ncbi:hypothetical protein [Nocardioides sp. NPDC047086]|uniref:hypothetical protein n=1 Tax=Nocardioides sp. NPDC047086 TaxID=3154810 RepID=UPI0033C435F5
MSGFDGAQGPAGGWWRGWTPWISALVLSALFAGATSGIAFVRKSYQPPVDYPAMTESEPAASTAGSASASPERDRNESPSTRPTGTPAEPRPVKAPRSRPSPSGSGSGEPMATTDPSESPFHPLGGLGVLLGLGEED